MVKRLTALACAMTFLGFGGPAQGAECSGLDTESSVSRIVGCINSLRDELQSTQAELRFTVRRMKDLVNKIDRSETAPPIPRGAVVAFDRPVCPEGWVPFWVGEGRVIVGATEKGDPSFVWQRTGGEKTVTLTVDQMPKHRHRISTDNKSTGIHDGLGGGSYPRGKDYGILVDFADIPNKPGWPAVLPNVLEVTGGDQSHNNMPPYIALYFCKKD